MNDRFRFGANIARNAASTDKKVVADKAVKRQLKNDDLHRVIARELDDLCTPPKPGEQWRIITQKRFNAYALVLRTLMERDIEDLWIAIYRINVTTAKSLINLIEQGMIKRANFIISSFFVNNKTQDEAAVALLRFAEMNECCRVVYVSNHAKIACVHAGDDWFVFEGSGNLSDNARIEQYIYENSREMYDFHTEWMDDVIKDFGYQPSQ